MELDTKTILKNISILDKANIPYREIHFSKHKVVITLDNGFSIDYCPYSSRFKYRTKILQSKTAKGLIQWMNKQGVKAIQTEKTTHDKDRQALKAKARLDIKSGNC